MIHTMHIDVIDSDIAIYTINITMYISITLNVSDHQKHD